jgi:hypothetical protein
MRDFRLVPAYAALAVLMTLPVAGCSGVFGNDSATEDFHAVATHTPKTISVDNEVGSIDVEAWDKPGVQIDARKRGATEDDVHAITITVKPDGDTLDVASDLGSGGNGRKVAFTLHAPARVNLTLKQSVGGIEAKGFTGDLDTDTSTGAASITMGRAAAPQHIHIEVTIGGIRLALPGDTSASVEASATVGGMTSDFPLTIDHGSVGQRGSGNIGSGGATIELSTTTGGIEIKRE